MTSKIKELIGIFLFILALISAYFFLKYGSDIKPINDFITKYDWVIYAGLIIHIALGSYGLNLANTNSDNKGSAK
jgi:hypothetical protein